MSPWADKWSGYVEQVSEKKYILWQRMSKQNETNCNIFDSIKSSRKPDA